MCMIPPASLTRRARLLVVLLVALLAACGGRPAERRNAAGEEVALFALGLLDTGYRFGGRNPEAGIDCSGLVSYVYRQAIGHSLGGSAADMARRGRAVDADAAQAGDLLFFNTRNQPASHVGIYLGDGRFIHAPASKGVVRIERLDNPYFAARFEGARSYLD